MAVIRDNTMPLQSIRDVQMLRLSLQCLTLPTKEIKLPFKSFSNVWREYSLKLLSRNIPQCLKHEGINCIIISEDHISNDVCVLSIIVP